MRVLAIECTSAELPSVLAAIRQEWSANPHVADKCAMDLPMVPPPNRNIINNSAQSTTHNIGGKHVVVTPQRAQWFNMARDDQEPIPTPPRTNSTAKTLSFGDLGCALKSDAMPAEVFESSAGSLVGESVGAPQVLAGLLLLGHHPKFDMAYLKRQAEHAKAELQWACTIPIPGAGRDEEEYVIDKVREIVCTVATDDEDDEDEEDEEGEDEIAEEEEEEQKDEEEDKNDEDEDEEEKEKTDKTENKEEKDEEYEPEENEEIDDEKDDTDEKVEDEEQEEDDDEAA